MPSRSAAFSPQPAPSAGSRLRGRCTGSTPRWSIRIFVSPRRTESNRARMGAEATQPNRTRVMGTNEQSRPTPLGGGCAGGHRTIASGPRMGCCRCVVARCRQSRLWPTDSGSSCRNSFLGRNPKRTCARMERCWRSARSARSIPPASCYRGRALRSSW